MRPCHVTIRFVFAFVSIAAHVVAQSPVDRPDLGVPNTQRTSQFPTAMFAGGCFWSVESDFDKLPGVVDVVVGYSGGRSKNPTYDSYATNGHREVVLVTYDPGKITYRGLVEYLIKHIDPLDRSGSFVDRGKQYSPAIYFADDEEKQSAKAVIAAIDRAKVFRKPISVAILPRSEFWPAESYHQNYHVHHAVAYRQYRAECGRDAFIAQYWGAESNRLSLPGAFPTAKQDESDRRENEETKLAADKPFWEEFRKPTPAELQKQLTKLQMRVTQGEFTETPFANEFWNYHEQGIYVDVVSGEPLFSSTDKFESGTGWPSFVKPLEEKCIVYEQDYSEYPVRIEVRSKYGDSHLGHVFNDGPPNRGGMRFCINSAALRFVPLRRMKDDGYEQYLRLFSQQTPVSK